MAEHGQESGPAPGAAALHGSRGDAEDLGGLGHGVSLHVHENEGGALVDGQLGQRGQELTVEILTLGGGLRGLMGFEELFHPLGVVQRGGLAGGGLADAVEAGIDGDAVEPGGHSGLAAKGVGGAKGGDESVLDGVGRLLAVPQRAQCDGPQSVAVPPYELAEGVGIAGDMCAQEILVARVAECGVVQR
jgi:hypothetical protein